MSTVLKKNYLKNPSETMLHNCTKEINLFLGKYKSIMVDDFSTIEKV
jgi:hypothetical protein